MQQHLVSGSMLDTTLSLPFPFPHLFFVWTCSSFYSRRYFCRVNAATGLPEVVAENVEATCAVDANATNTTAGGARRLQSTPCDATSAQARLGEGGGGRVM